MTVDLSRQPTTRTYTICARHHQTLLPGRLVAHDTVGNRSGVSADRSNALRCRFAPPHFLHHRRQTTTHSLLLNCKIFSPHRPARTRYSVPRSYRRFSTYREEMTQSSITASPGRVLGPHSTLQMRLPSTKTSYPSNQQAILDQDHQRLAIRVGRRRYIHDDCLRASTDIEPQS